MILRVRRNFFEITTFPNSGIRAWFYALMLCTSRTQVVVGVDFVNLLVVTSLILIRRHRGMKRPGPTLHVLLRETGSTD